MEKYKPSYRPSIYVAWDEFFDDIDRAQPADPIMTAHSAVVYYEALNLARAILKTARHSR